MRIALIGRTNMLLQAAEILIEEQHQLPLIVTAKAEQFYDVKESDFSALARKAGSKFYVAKNLETEEIPAAIDEAKCDIAVSMNWPYLIGDEILNRFPLGVFNAHPGALPRYKGNACPNWAIINGENSIGLTIHKMSSELDAGPIFVTDTLHIDERTYISDVYDWLQVAVPQAFLKLIKKLESQETEGMKQGATGIEPLRCYPRIPSDSKIDWSKQTDEILRLIRASSKPFSGAYSDLENSHTVYIWRAEKYEKLDPFLAMPGQVACVVEGNPVILAGDGAIRLTDFSVFDQDGNLAAQKTVTKSMRARLF